ncbi:hypothetical protein BDN72DRAFT_830079 [Pluteus cervinus]|uniref:Uncharacterized protein n=1 Tax=Pluteus cervinus TaxID=181527 RepID=A0ACD3BFU5_9AGAR|nr:hypothetical protein BDN72DRAFT_830079 [Pluteus cervinus]
MVVQQPRANGGSATTSPYAIPIPERPPTSWTQKFKALLFVIVFDFGLLWVNGSQFVFLLPLRFVPIPWAKRLYDDGIRMTKGWFGCLLILMCQWFAPTRIHITFEKEGLGKFTEEEIEQIIVKDKSGNFKSLNLPRKFVLIANHQIYADWWYAWCLLYYVGEGVHRHIFITLKKSLQWVPVAGWGMQFFRFIFLSRSWAADRAHLAKSLADLGKEAEKEDRPLCFVLYPEGTLVSQNTRPISKKFADKMGISDMKHQLLPRSTGLHYSLRSLAPRIPDLHLLDMTVNYPGIPPMGYGQSYYTLRSIFMDGVAPPVINVHLRLFRVVDDVPIGKSIAPKTGAVADIPEAEKDVFDLWLRTLWQEKDEWMEAFFEKKATAHAATVEIPLKLRR